MSGPISEDELLEKLAKRIVYSKLDTIVIFYLVRSVPWAEYGPSLLDSISSHSLSYLEITGRYFSAFFKTQKK